MTDFVENTDPLLDTGNAPVNTGAVDSRESANLRITTMAMHFRQGHVEQELIDRTTGTINYRLEGNHFYQILFKDFENADREVVEELVKLKEDKSRQDKQVTDWLGMIKRKMERSSLWEENK